MDQKISYKQAEKIFFTLLHVWSDVAKEFEGYTNEEIRVFLIFCIHRFKTVKEMKEHMLKQVSNCRKNNIEVKLAKFLKILVNKKLIYLENSSQDKRVKMIIITESGKKIYAELEKKLEQKWKEQNVEHL